MTERVAIDLEELERRIAAAHASGRAEQRERDAKVCEALSAQRRLMARGLGKKQRVRRPDKAPTPTVAEACAAAIRAGGDKP